MGRPSVQGTDEHAKYSVSHIFRAAISCVETIVYNTTLFDYYFDSVNLELLKVGFQRLPQEQTRLIGKQARKI
jgi:hypothetical protein